MPLMRPIYGKVGQKLSDRYIRIRSGIKKKLSGRIKTSVQQVDSEDTPFPEWDLPLPGSAIMKTIDLHLSQLPRGDPDHDSDTTLVRNETKGQAVGEWV